MPPIPNLTTDRLLLRPMTFADWPAYRQMLQGERSSGMGGPHEIGYAWGMFCHDHAQWSLFGHGALMIEDLQSGQCVGQVGINAGPLFPEPEFGWMVYDGFEGQGYAFEAAAALLSWAKTQTQIQSLVSYIDDDNSRSRKLAERLGASLDKYAVAMDPEDLVYRHF
ncbi:N-acetyltransferase [Roseibium aquae]|uniref:N-acetyltransferase n=1 Tax=Roseibium aquae TaxID=1323746 RepID=A0A916TML4_9HYPH|nr:GNAT family N-acetyltransferase [Roseibium aquae]GGB58364.1 N-acetyltransferase [Roseibium aquae]